MRYFIDYKIQNVEATADDLLEAGFKFILNGREVIFRDAVTLEDLEPFNIISI
jgi:hypothetical protein